MASCPSLKCWKLILFVKEFDQKWFVSDPPLPQKKYFNQVVTQGICHTPMTSSLRNSLHRRNHKERSQLAHRAKYGILEKHKDYVLRARDYHSKQDRLNRLKHKAANKNKDEFYFAMKNERTVEGVHVKDRGNTSMPMDMVKLLKTQDEGYVRTIKTVGLKVRLSTLSSRSIVHSP